MHKILYIKFSTSFQNSSPMYPHLPRGYIIIHLYIITFISIKYLMMNYKQLIPNIKNPKSTLAFKLIIVVWYIRCSSLNINVIEYIIILL